MDPAESVTLGELSRSLAGLERRMDAGFGAIGRRLDNLEFVPRGEHNLQVKELSDRVKDLEESKKWTSRTLIAAFLYPVLVAAVVALMVTR